jgi:hypothetical protein
MRRDQVDGEKDKESYTKSGDEAFGHGNIPTVLKE